MEKIVLTNAQLNAIYKQTTGRLCDCENETDKALLNGALEQAERLLRKEDAYSELKDVSNEEILIWLRDKYRAQQAHR